MSRRGPTWEALRISRHRMKSELGRCFLALAAAGACMAPSMRCTRRPPLQTKSVEGTSTVAAEPIGDTDTALSDPGGDVDWVLEPSGDGTVGVLRRGKRVLTMRYVFWGEKWTWADPTVENLKR